MHARGAPRRFRRVVVLTGAVLILLVYFCIPATVCLPDLLFSHPHGTSWCPSPPLRRGAGPGGGRGDVRSAIAGSQLAVVGSSPSQPANRTMTAHHQPASGSKLTQSKSATQNSLPNHASRTPTTQLPLASPLSRLKPATPGNDTLAKVSSDLVALARDLTAGSKSRGPLLVTMVNSAFLPIAYNWLCHTARFHGVHDNILFLVQGNDTAAKLKERWPTSKTFPVHQSDQEMKGALTFGTVGYVRMMIRRTKLLNAMIQANISFILTEMDFVWYRNPVPDFLQLARKKNLDIVGTISSVPGQIMCGAFIYFRNTRGTRILWAEVTRRMHVLEERLKSDPEHARAPLHHNEQVYLNRLFSEHYRGVRYGMVTYDTVVDGPWYTQPSLRRKHRRPKAVHNNFLQKSEDKVHRFVKFGQWTLDHDYSCSSPKVHSLQRGLK